MLENSPLGQTTHYIDRYDPSSLFPIARHTQRQVLSLTSPLPFDGHDLWNGYEFSWLNPVGKPQIALVEIINPCTSPNLIESKSLKLYLNSFNLTRFKNTTQVLTHLTDDLTQTAGAAVQVRLHAIDSPNYFILSNLPGDCLDGLPIAVTDYQPKPQFLQTAPTLVTESLHSHLFRSNCPITHQPDWGSICIRYTGPQIHREGLLQYIISYRQHPEFHEHCVERLFMDILQHCQPTQLTVYARFTRRGGLDINPFRSNFEAPYGNLRLIRQ
ncbi:MAG: NADPH-dependent 7-cyano-7-deazaguanine reductase QueF [Legionellales bacterium]|nr:NADPH-dependent 7-cyano-7-deazaguanine reductase QueF [Legionellales bacterium]